MKRIAIGGTALAIAIGVTTAISAQEPRGQSSDKPAAQRPAEAGPASRTDAEAFIRDMAIAGMAEVQLGKLASERASNNEVKEFGQLMVRDHSKANDELKEVAGQLKVQMPGELDQKHKDLQSRLSTLKGAEFDREYMGAMVKGHEEVLGKLKAFTDARVPPTGAAGAHEGAHDAGAKSPGTRTPGARASNPPAAQSGADKSSPTRGDVTGRGRGDDRLIQWAAKAMPTVQQHLDRARQINQKVAK